MRKFIYFKMRKLVRMAFFVASVCIIPTQVNGQTYTETTIGIQDGWYFDFWKDNSQGSASMTLGPSGNYSTTWTNVANFIGGIGWKVGKEDRSICYDGTFSGGNNGYLALYGWTRNELVEYYVVENHGVWIPPGNSSEVKYQGTFTCDGGTYKIYKAQITSKLTIYGSPYYQYWSVRTQKRSSGTVTFSKHVEEWKKYGMNLGTTWEFQIMMTEGYQSSGNSNITVRECDASPITVKITEPIPSVIQAPATLNIAATASTLSGTITTIEFYNGTTKLGEDNSEPYSILLENIQSGTYSLTAVAINSQGTSATSAPVQVTIENTPDQIALKKGWNIIGCPFPGSTPIETALSEIWDKVESVKDLDAYYIKTNPVYLNTLLKLDWGKGYMIKVSDGCEIVK